MSAFPKRRVAFTMTRCLTLDPGPGVQRKTPRELADEGIEVMPIAFGKLLKNPVQ